MSANAPSIKATRSPLIDLFLSSITFSVFLFVWLYQAVRDLNRTREQGLTPWLWIFVPLLLIPSFFALPILLRAIKVCEKDLDLGSWSRLQDVFWLIAVWTLSACSVIFNYLDTSSLQQFVVHGLWLVSYFLIAPRINRIRQASELPKTKLFAKLSIIEWVIAFICTPLFIAILWFSGINTYFASLEKLETHQVVNHVEHNYSLTFVGDSWHRVDIGTYSNGEAIAEFSGFDSESSLIVFAQNDRENASGLIHWRIDEARNFMSDAKCKENRAFLSNSLYLRIQLRCEGLSLNRPALQIHELVQIAENDYIEIFARYTADEHKFNKHSLSFTQTVQSLNAAIKDE